MPTLPTLCVCEMASDRHVWSLGVNTPHVQPNTRRLFQALRVPNVSLLCFVFIVPSKIQIPNDRRSIWLEVRSRSIMYRWLKHLSLEIIVKSTIKSSNHILFINTSSTNKQCPFVNYDAIFYVNFYYIMIAGVICCFFRTLTSRNTQFCLIGFSIRESMCHFCTWK